MREWTQCATATDIGQRLDTFWQNRLEAEGVARSRVQVWIRDGRAQINGQVCRKPSTRILPGQELRLEADLPDAGLVPDPGLLRIVFADDCLAILDKEPGLTVHPAASVSGPTLLHRAAYHFPSLLEQSGERPGIVHRLDKDSSGLLVLALSEFARLNLIRAFASRTVYKEYLALVAGVPACSGVVTLPVGRHPVIKTRMAVVQGGRPAESRFQAIWSAPDRSASLLRVRILTGRTHQIRVHMAALGHPLLGDTVYADKHTASRAPRQMLHAWQLRFTHPHTDQDLRFCCPPPEDFRRVLEGLAMRPVCIGVTGAAGSGKSTIRQVAEAMGVPVFCADRTVAQAYEPGAQGCQILEHYFGTRFSRPQGGIDKSVLGAAMGAEPGLRREVERLIHPLVCQALRDFRAAHAQGVSLAEIPLLCEAGLQDAVDLTAVVYCPDALRHARLRGRGWSAEHVAEVDSWQWSQEKKLGAAHLVLDNSGTLDQSVARSRAMIRLVQAISQARTRRVMDSLDAVFAHPEPEILD